MDRISEKYNSLNNELRNTNPLFRSNSIEEDGAAKLFDRENVELRDKVRELLAVFERLAVGVNMEAFEIDVIKKMSKGYLITVFERYFTYIQAARKRGENDSLFEEFESLVERLRIPDDPEHALDETAQRQRVRIT